jgi:putative tryptophan/tyrosine transport system substrate-binding protein
MRRRDFIEVIAGSVVAWPVIARAERGGMRRVGALMNKTADDAQGRREVLAFETALQKRGWKTGDNMQIDYRWGAGDLKLYRKFATELVELSPDVLFGVGGTVVGALQQATLVAPIVFVETTDPVGRGLIASLSRPGGNTTGFTQFEFSISGKWLELLKEIVPGLTRSLVIRDPGQFSGIGEFAAIEAVAPSLGVELTALDARNTSEIEHVIPDFARRPASGLVVTPSGASIKNRNLIISLANQHRLPAIYTYSYFVTDGGLISYGPEETEPYALAAGYIDRILKGEKPSDLPVQAPTAIELAINLKTAKALALTIPPSLVATANQVIE